MNKDIDQSIFEDMPVPKALAAMALPTILSQLITTVYNLADAFFIGKTNDPYKVAALSLAFVLHLFLTAIANLFGIGGGSLISRLLGKFEQESARHICAFSVYGALLLSLVYSAGVFMFMEPLLRIMGASNDTLPYAQQYAVWAIIVGGVPTVLSITAAHILRSVGYARQASLGIGLGGILNIILDPVFMFGLLPPGMEVTGAAVATMLSNVFSTLFLMICFFHLKNRTVLCLSLKGIFQSKKHILSVLVVGIPTALGTMLTCVSNTIVNRMAADYGDIPLAAAGIIKRVYQFPYSAAIGIGQGMLPLVAYNYASGNYSRMRQTIRCAMIFSMAFASVLITVYELLPSQIIRLFINERTTIVLAADFLRIVCTAMPFVIFNFQICYVFQAMGMGKEALIISACRQGIIYIPMILLMNAVFKMYGVIWAQTITDMLALLISVVLYMKTNRNLRMQESSKIG